MSSCHVRVLPKIIFALWHFIKGCFVRQRSARRYISWVNTLCLKGYEATEQLHASCIINNLYIKCWEDL